MSNDFGTRLKELRKQTGMTQKELADKLGVTKSVVSFYELRERAPSPEILVKLTSIFDVTSDYLLGIDRVKCIDISGLDADDERAVLLIVDRLRKKNSSIK